MKQITHQKFFEEFGDTYLHPTSYGESFRPLAIEEMYQQFKARLLYEVKADSDELIEWASLIDTESTKVTG